MKSPLILATTLLGLCSLSSNAQTTEVIWSEDFENATLGDITTTNVNLAGSNIQVANTLTAEVVTAPPAFTSASGNCILLSTGANNFSAIRPSSALNPINLPAIAAGGTWTLSFDIYIPTDLAQSIGGIANYRWKDGGANNVNGPSDYTQEVLTAGVHHFEYTGTFPIDIGNGPYLPNNVRPHINFDQANTAIANFFYFDNLNFEVEVSSDDPNISVGGASFGELNLDSGTYSRPVSISNTGSTQTLTITGATLGGTNPTKFAVTNTTFPLNIAPGATGSIEVTFDSATDLGPFSATLDLSSNDQTDSSTSLALSATTFEPLLGRELIANGDFEAGDLTNWRGDNRHTFVATPTQSGAGGSLYTFQAAQQWGNARLATTPPLGDEFDPVQLAITSDMYGKDYQYSAWFYRPSTNGMADTDEIAFVMRWNKLTPTIAPNITHGITLGSDMPFDTWIRIVGRGTIPEFDNDGNPVTSLEPVWSFRDNGADNPGGLLLYMDEVSLIVDVPATPPVVTFPVMTSIEGPDTAGDVTFSWTSAADQFFIIEYSSDLATWIELEDAYPATGASTSYSLSSPAGTARRFYRVTLEGAGN